MNVYAALALAIPAIEGELARVAAAEGYPAPVLTGNLLFVHEQGAVWFEVKDSTNTTSWVTADMEERAAWGETLVAASSREEALEYDESN